MKRQLMLLLLCGATASNAFWPFTSGGRVGEAVPEPVVKQPHVFEKVSERAEDVEKIIPQATVTNNKAASTSSLQSLLKEAGDSPMTVPKHPSVPSVVDDAAVTGKGVLKSADDFGAGILKKSGENAGKALFRKKLLGFGAVAIAATLGGVIHLGITKKKTRRAKREAHHLGQIRRLRNYLRVDSDY